MYDCKIIRDSISDEGHRLTTFQVTFPRIILAEVNTHRMLSRNSASSRAIPVSKMIASVTEDPFFPEVFGSAVKGMTAGEPVREQAAAKLTWAAALDDMLVRAQAMDDLSVTKGLSNRLLEPFKWHTAILTATDWGNLFALRNHPDAQGEFQKLAEMMEEAYFYSEPKDVKAGEWHVSYVTNTEIDDEALAWPEPFIDWEMWRQVSTGRSARVSYETHEGQRDRQADIDLHNRLAVQVPRHLSPTEHQATPFTSLEWDIIDTVQSAVRMLYTSSHPTFVDRLCRIVEYCGNVRGWTQYRATFPNEHDASLT